MASAITARRQGDDYQARFFWLRACDLFDEHTRVTGVGFEDRGVRTFDDVVVYYAADATDEQQRPLAADYHQLKFHVRQDGAVTCAALEDPSFIGAEAVSLLERLRDAQRVHAPDGTGARFHLVTPWNVDADDPLSRLLDNNRRALQLDRLAAGGPRSAMGQLRARWRTHLGLATDEALLRVVGTLRLHAGYHPLDQLRELASARLQSAGFAAMGAGELVTKFDAMPFQLHAAGTTRHTRASLETAARAERLWIGRPLSPAAPVLASIRSFPGADLAAADDAKRQLSLVEYFDGRRVRSANAWSERIVPALRTFADEIATGPRACVLRLDVHASIAFAAGYLLHPKRGVDVRPIQPGQGQRGPAPWTFEPSDTTGDGKPWTEREIALDRHGHDVALVLSAARDAHGDAVAFVERACADVARIVSLRIRPRVSSTSVRDGAHALQLAQCAAEVAARRTPEERRGVLHVFAAVPNTLLFALGQLAIGFGRVVTYEYAFEANEPAGFEAAIAFP